LPIAISGCSWCFPPEGLFDVSWYINGVFGSSQQEDNHEQPFPNCVFNSNSALLPYANNNKMQGLPEK
jgi:hypothetical protein